MNRLLVALAVVAAFVGLWAGPTTTPSGSADEGVQILIEEVKPTVPKARSNLRISGRIVNSGELPIVAPTVQLRLSPIPLTSRSEVTSVLDGTSERSGTPIAGSLQTLDQDIQPGQEVMFETSVRVRDLGLPTEAGVYAIFVELLSQAQILGQAGATLPWFPNTAEYAPSQVALLWPITQKPAVAADDLVLEPALPGEFSAGGRLESLRSAAADKPVAWLVDSATLQTAGELSDGYRVLTSAGPEAVGDSVAANDFRDRLSAQLAGRRVTLPQFAIADGDALERAGMTPFVVRAASLPGVLGARQLSDSERTQAYLAPGGRITDETLRVLVDAGIRRVIISDRAMRPQEELTYTPTGAAPAEAGGGDVDFLLTDTQLSLEFAGDLSTPQGRTRATQAILADLAMITLERPSEPRNVVALPPLTWNPPPEWAESLLSDVVAAPWTDMIPLSAVDQGPLVERRSLRFGAKAREAELPRAYLKRVKGLSEQLDSLLRIVDDPVGFGEGFTLAMQRATSSLWREDRPGRNRLVETLSHQVDAEKQKVRVVSTGSVTLAGDNGILPLTIANDLERDVTVGIELRTENQIRLLYDPPGPIHIKASQKTGLEVPIRVVGSQPLEVTVVLTDREGQFYDESVSLELASTAASRVAGAVIGGAVLVLFILVGIRVARRRRHG